MKGKQTMTYIATGWLKHSEQDNYNDGCDPATSCTTGGHDSFSAGTIEDLIIKLSMFAGQSDLKNVILDSCEEAGRVAIQVYENKSGDPAQDYEITAWKAGSQDLYLCTYSFYVLKTEKIVLSRHVKNKDLYASA
jgi:hypothetical protein